MSGDKRFGPYEVLEEIGRGGMATVYRARQPSVDRDVAIKVIQRNVAANPNSVARFQREARLIARLEHPHILPVYDFDGAHDPPYIVMRYLDGGTLREVMHEGALPPADIVYVMRQVCAALDYAHRQGIIHRDIKPSNIMIDREGNAFVTDLGIARLTGAEKGEQITETGAILGTPDYMAPEQAGGVDEVDHRADLYALAVMIFQLLTGKLPFGGTTPVQILMQHMQAPIPSVFDFNADLPPTIDAFMFKALAKKRDDRFAGALELSEALVVALGGTMTGSPLRLRDAAATSIMRRLGGVEITETDRTPDEQRKQVTAIYISALPYAELVEEIAGNEAARRALKAFWEAAAARISEGGGVIFVRGDHDRLALWGAESAQEDDAECAVRVALTLHEVLRSLGAAFLDDEETLPLNIGIHSGVALLTSGDRTGTPTASGTPVSLANRLMQNAEGIILISHETFRQVRGVFDVAPDEALKMRGRKDSIPTYRVESAKPRAWRYELHGIEGIETRMVGRVAELTALQNAFLNMAEDHELQVITLTGDAGLGKSRLIYEFDEWSELRPERFFIFHGRGAPGMSQRPYALLRDMLAERFEILDNDPPAEVQRKLEAGVHELLSRPHHENAHLVGALVGFDAPASPRLAGLKGNPEELARQARQAFINLIVEVGRIDYAVIELEDLHHADDASLDLLNDLFNADQAIRLMVVAAARPALFTRRPDWGRGQPFHRHLELRPLDKRESRDLVRELLQNVAEIPRALRDLLVERAEGNPLYMEEMVKMMLDDHIIRKESDSTWTVEESRLEALSVPPTLIGLLEARFDTLLYPEKLTLQRAAVLGRIFYDSALVALDAADETHVGDLTGVLARLAERNFIVKRETSSIAGSAEYVFAQVMLRDIIYERLLERQMKSYHGAAARWLESLERAGDYLPLIAAHYQNAGDNEHAAAALFRSGAHAADIGSYPAAAEFYQQAVALLPPTPAPLRAAALLGLGTVFRIQRHLDEAQKALEAARSASAADVLFETKLHIEFIQIIMDRGDFEAVPPLLDTLDTLIQGVTDKALKLEATALRLQLYVVKSDFEPAEALARTILAEARALKNHNREMVALRQMGLIKFFLNQMEESNTFYEEMVTLARRLKRDDQLVAAFNNLGENMRKWQRYDEAVAYYQQALPLAQATGQAGQVAMLRANLAIVETVRGNFEAAIASLRAALTFDWQSGAIPDVLSDLAIYAQILAAQGEPERALALAGFCYHHPAADFNTRTTVDEELLPELRATLSEADIAAGIAQGEKLELAALVKSIVG